MVPYLRPHMALCLAAGGALSLAASSMLGLGFALRYLIDSGLSERAELNQAIFVLIGVTVLLALATAGRFGACKLYWGTHCCRSA